jgi:hypothetical protein
MSASTLTTVHIDQLGNRSPDGEQLGQAPTDLIGFYGAAPVVQPIGDGGSAGSYTYSAAAVVAALKALGLIAT